MITSKQISRILVLVATIGALMTIPTLALTGFALCFAFLLLAALPPVGRATVSAS